MHWQDACFRSAWKRAFRITRDGRFIYRHWDGSGEIQMYGHPDQWRKADISELEGFNDWEPDGPLKKESKTKKKSGHSPD